MNQLISGELEYKIDPEPYVENFPIVHLKSEELMKIDLKKYNMEIKHLETYMCDNYNNGNKILNYPNNIHHKICQDEYVIYTIMKNKSADGANYYIIYITNYGRIILSSECNKRHQCNNNNPP